MKEFSIYKVCRLSFPAENLDWREPFTNVSKWTDDEVAFEFLRRSRCYWSFIKQFYDLPDDPAEWPFGRLELCASNAGIDANRYDELKERAAKEFGLWKCCDPRLPIAGVWSPWTVAASISARYQWAVQKGYEYDHMEYRFGRHTPADTITIDLRADAPVEAQVEFVRWVLNRVRASAGIDHRTGPRFQRKLFGDYLRLLDGRNDGASLSTIANFIYGGRDDKTIDLVRKQIKAAEAIRDAGYRDLLLWSSKIVLPERLQIIPDKLDELAAELTDLAESGDSEGFKEVMAEFAEELERRKIVSS